MIIHHLSNQFYSPEIKKKIFRQKQIATPPNVFDKSRPVTLAAFPQSETVQEMEKMAWYLAWKDISKSNEEAKKYSETFMQPENTVKCFPTQKITEKHKFNKKQHEV